jgi:ribosome biogenesis GTPase A
VNEVNQYYQRLNNKKAILVLGAPGVGKSSFINTIA